MPTAIRLILATVFSSLPLTLPAEDTDAISPQATKVNWDFTHWCQVGPHRFTLEKTTLQDVIRTLGPGKIERNGKPNSAVFDWYVSYRWNHQTISFLSNSDMGGPDRVLDEIEIEDRTNDTRLTQLPNAPIIFPFGQPGMSFKALQAKLGTSASLLNGFAEYQYPGHFMGKDAQGKPVPGDTTGWLRVKIVRDHVVQIEMSRVTTY